MIATRRLISVLSLMIALLGLAAPASAADREISADVFIWDAASQGIGALRALQMPGRL